ncbi:Asp23/Gls24 family envelope stress response protein [Microbacterium sp. NPDC007973]|uniref:Asp23/Gls24 family envelope stress response protein n=1 Tax=Microbacterium sp. NPDC007973 TaxID=3364182 RepID=UPI0036E26199
MTTIDATIDPPDLDAAASLAATAAGSVPGVHALGSLLGRASDAVRERVGLASTAPGVKIDADRADSVTATISLVVDYPHKLHEVSDAVRTAVRTALEPLGRGRIDVDVVVTGVFGPFDRDVVAEAEDKADAATAAVREKAEAAGDRAREIAGEAKKRADAASAAVREQTADAAAVVREKADDAAKALGDAKDAASDLAAGAAAAAGEFARQNAEATRREQAEADIDAADRVTEGLEPTDEGSALDTTDPAAEEERADVRGDEERADVRDVVAEALEDAAVDIAIAADEVRGDDETPAVDGVQSVVEDERPRS